MNWETLKLSKRQKDDIETILYFILCEDKCKITNDDILEFMLFSDKGIKPNKETEAFDTLKSGKIWRQRHCQGEDDELGMWEEGVKTWMIGGYLELLNPFNDKELLTPAIVKYMSNTMFKGADKFVINTMYDEALTERGLERKDIPRFQYGTETESD